MLRGRLLGVLCHLQEYWHKVFKFVIDLPESLIVVLLLFFLCTIRQFNQSLYCKVLDPVEGSTRCLPLGQSEQTVNIKAPPALLDYFCN
jgi:hypothetical protein